MRRLVLLALFLLAVWPVFGANVTVGCPGGTPGMHTSINAALATLDQQGPHTIVVSGTCTESVAIDQRERLTIQAPQGSTATIIGTGPVAITVRNSEPVLLRGLTVSASRTAIAVFDNSMVTITGVDAQASQGNAIEVIGAIAHFGGPATTDAVRVHGSFNGMRVEGSSIFVTGRLTAENNQNAGVTTGTSRLVFAGAGAAGANVFRNNGTAGINAANSAYVELVSTNLIQNNGSNGIILTAMANAHIRGGVTIEGHPRSGVAVLFNSTFHSSGNNVIRNNGSAGDPFRAGISTSHNSMVWLGGGAQIVNNIGRGILADSGTSLRLDNTTLSGNSEEAIVLIHGAILESIAANNVAGPVSCDSTAIVFGDLAGFPAFECAKKGEKK